jgi:hypothetical protein
MQTLVSPGQTVSLTIMGENPDPVSARVVTVSREIVVACEKPTKIGAAIRIDVPEGMLLGDVISIEPQNGTAILAIRHCIHSPTIDQIRQNWK